VPARRAEILDAALRCFLEHGVAGATIEQIRDRSGASVGSIYHHFGGKDGLAGALYTAALGDYQHRFLAALESNPAAPDGVPAVVATHLHWCLREQPDRARYLLFHAGSARPAAGAELTELNREFFRAVLGWWRPRVRTGELRDLPVDLINALWLGPAQEYCRLHLSGQSVSANEHETVLADAAWRALRGGAN
jgi:AcrR family transcriptional regulator